MPDGLSAVPSATGTPTRVEAIALIYVALPTLLFVATWVLAPFGPIAAAAMAAAIVACVAPRPDRRPARERPGPRGSWLALVVVAASWCVLGGIGHFVYANSDWVVRDAVLVDLVRDPWPVRYRVDGTAWLLRAPIGYFLPAAAVGKLAGLAVAEQALLAWTVLGVVLTFALMLRDHPPPVAALVRIGVFVAFSGMDIVGTFTHYDPHALGDHLEWWAFLFQYSSQTTQLFWVPNHALPGWIAMAWLLGQDPRRLSTTTAILFVLFAPLWSPLTALGIAPIVGVALVRRVLVEPAAAWRAVVDWRMLVCLATCFALVYPYLVAGSDTVASGASSDLRFVGEDIVPRTIEFLLFEVAGFAVLVIARDPRDPLRWAALAVLLLLPLYRFGPFNDLAMRASIPALTLFAIDLGRWLSEARVARRQPRRVTVACLLLAIGAVTPFMEFARIFVEARWAMDTRASVVDVTRGTHYLASPDHAWLRRILKPGGPHAEASR